MTFSDITKELREWKFSKYKVINLSIGIFALLVYEFLGRPIYRPYIYTNRINDFHVADTLGNSLGTIAAIFIMTAIFSSEMVNGKYLIRVIAFSVVLYELAQPLFGKPVDLWDVLATILTGFLCYLLFVGIFKSKNS